MYCHVLLMSLSSLLLQHVHNRSKSSLLSQDSTVTEPLVLRPLLEDRGRITESIRILVPVNRIKHVFRSRRNESVDRSSFSSVGSLFHARGAVTEKALSPICRRVRGTTRLPRDEVRSVVQPGILAAGIRRSEMYSCIVSQKRLVNQQLIAQ